MNLLKWSASEAFSRKHLPLFSCRPIGAASVKLIQMQLRMVPAAVKISRIVLNTARFKDRKNKAERQNHVNAEK